MERKFRLVGLMILCFSLLTSGYSVIIEPGIDADITYSDSSKGIWWSTLSIYARTGISVGDIIEIPYNASNSTDYGLFPLMLSIKVNNVRTIICVNELLDNIAPYTSYPICLFNNDEWFAEAGFNYSTRESQSLFTTKEYDVTWGKFHQPTNTIPIGYSFTGYENDYNTSFFSSQSSFFSDTYLGGIQINSFLTKLFTHSNSNDKVDYNYYHDGVPNFVDRINYSTIINHYSCDSGDVAQRRVIFYLGSSTTTHSSGGDYYDNGLSGDFRNNMFYNVSVTLHPTRVYSDSQSNSYHCTVSGTNPIEVRYDSFQNNLNFTSVKKFSYCNDLTLGSKLLNVSCNEKIYLKFNQTQEQETLDLPFSKHVITKESDDPVYGLNIVPYQTNSYWKAFPTIDTLDSSNLWFNLNEFDTPVLTHNLDSYFVDGVNSILTDQTNEEGGYFLFFEGQDNSPPSITQPSLNVTAIEIDETIYCNAGIMSDAENDTITDVEFAWELNGVEIGVTTQTLILSTQGISEVKNDVVRCKQRASDGNGFSNWAYSSSVSVIGVKPTAIINLTPSSPSVGQDVIFSISSINDLDGDVLNTTLICANSTSNLTTINLGNLTSGNLTLNGSYIVQGEAYTCKALIDDTSAITIFEDSFGVGNVGPSLITGLNIDSTYSYDGFIYTSTGCVATDVNGDDITYTYQINNNGTWDTVYSTQDSKVLIDTDSFQEGSYSFRCFASDGISNSEFSMNPQNISIQDYSTNLIKDNEYFYVNLFSISKGVSVSNSQFSNGGTSYSAGDLMTNVPTEIISYLPVEFDGNRGIKEFSFNPAFARVDGVEKVSGSVSGYGVAVYEVDSIEEIPSGVPLTYFTNQKITIGQKNSFDLSGIIPQNGKYIAIKVCLNLDTNSFICGVESDSLADSIFINGKSSGTYKSKINTGSGIYSDVFDLNVIFDWEKEKLDKTKIALPISYSDGMSPKVLAEKLSGKVICSTESLSLSENVPACIELIKDNIYGINLENLESNVEYEIWGGKDYIFNSPGVLSTTITKSTTTSANSKLVLVGAELSGSYLSSPGVKVNSQNLWSTVGDFNQRSITNSFNSLILSGANNIQFESNSNGVLEMYFKPIRSELVVTYPNVVEPKKNALSPVDVSFTTLLDLNLGQSKCELIKDGTLIQTSTVSVSNNIYSCSPTLESHAESGIYTLKITVQDGSGLTDSFEGTFSFSEHVGLVVESIVFDSVEISSENRKINASFEFKNVGNSDITSISIKGIDKNFWDFEGINYFDIGKRMLYSFIENGLSSLRDRKDFTVSQSINVLGTGDKLAPGETKIMYFQLDTNGLNLDIDSYSTEMEVTYE